jgi:hypothetical protein
MKHLIFIALLIALHGCERDSSESKDKAQTETAQDESASEATLSYLNQPLKGKVSQRGLYKLVRSGGLVEDSRTSTGKAIANPVIQLVRSTERIPLIKGLQMHLQFRLWPFPDQPAFIDLRRTLKHPAMNLPDGSISTGSDYMMKAKVSVNQVIAYTGYGLDEDYEMVEGDWVFEIWYRDKKMIKQTFTTYWPDEDEIAALKSKP